MITVAQALDLLASVAPRAIGTERVPLRDALGRVLAREVASDVDWPPFDTSAMDGYAVRLADLSAAGRGLPERTSVVAAGDPHPPRLAPGEAVRVMTGAPIPEGTEAIIPVERARREDGRVIFEVTPSRGDHVRRRGESVAVGGVLLPAGRRLAPVDVALASLTGCDPVEAFQRPRVTVVATGNELVASHETPSAGQLRDSNGPMLASLCRARGWPVAYGPRVADEAPVIERLFAAAGREEDVLVTSGGVSAGDFDLLPGVARRCGFEILFHGVSVRPGKPIILARRDATLWFGLPGNPVSAAVGFHLFVRYALDRLEGSAAAGAPRIAARLAGDLKACGPRETYKDAVLTAGAGTLSVEPIRSRGSHDIAAFARANALIRLEAGSPATAAGQIVECVLVADLKMHDV